MKTPTVEEVQAYCDERGNTISAQGFYDYYEQVGWKVGKTRKPMVSWQAAVRLWERDKPKPMQAFINKHSNTDWVNG